MKAIIRKTLLFAAFVVLTISFATGQRVIKGTVYLEGKPAAGITVEAHKGGQMLTSFDGKYEVEADAKSKWLKFTFIDEIKRLMGTENVKVLDMAEVPKSPAKPEKMVIIIVTGFIGMMMGLFIAFSREYIDNTIKTPRDVERKLGIQVMGVIPSYEKPRRRGHDRGNNI